MFSQRKILKSTKDYSAEIDRLKMKSKLLMPLSLVQERDCPRLLDLLTVENALKNIFGFH